MELWSLEEVVAAYFSSETVMCEILRKTSSSACYINWKEGNHGMSVVGHDGNGQDGWH